MNEDDPRDAGLRIGIQLPEVEREVRWSELADMARLAEDAGFDSLWVGDHLLYRFADIGPRGPWEAWSLLAALAAVTTRVELGPLVAATAFHNPAMLAKKAATVDEISGGRLILGLGAGWNETEFRAFGFPFDRRVARFAEAFTIVRTLLRDGAIDFSGEFYRLEDCVLDPRGPRPDGPPLLIGSMGPRMLRLTMPYADGWNAWYAWIDNRAENLAPLMAQVDAALESAGRSPSAVERTAAVLVALDDGAGRRQGHEHRGSGGALTGSSEEIAAGLLSFHAAGITHLQLVVDPITLRSIEALVPVLELIRREVAR